MAKFFSQSLYFVVGVKRPFFHKRDAQYYCADNGLDPKESITKFDSKKEYTRWLELQDLERRGEILGLRRQVEFELIPAHKEIEYELKERQCWDVEDVESFRTKAEAVAYCRANGIKPNDTHIRKVVKMVRYPRERVIEQNAVYTADFTYTTKDGEFVVEDVKSPYTAKEPDYVLRRKLMLFRHGIKIKEYE